MTEIDRVHDTVDALSEPIGRDSAYIRPVQPDLWGPHAIVAVGWPPMQGALPYELVLVRHTRHETGYLEVARGWAGSVPRFHPAYTPMRLVGYAQVKEGRTDGDGDRL